MKKEVQGRFIFASVSENLTERAEGSETTITPQWRYTAGNLASGAIAGCAVETGKSLLQPTLVAALYPIDTIKTRLQAVTTGGIKQFFSKGGGKALFAGLSGNLLGVAPASAIFMGVYEPTKTKLLNKLPKDKHYIGTFFAGAAAGIAASIVRVPTEVIKQRSQMREFSSFKQAVSTIARNEGPRGFFSGYSAFLLRDLPFDAIEFCAYESIKRSYRNFKGKDLNVLEVSGVGALAGAITGFTTTPLDVLKTRMMIQGKDRVYKNIFQASNKILKEEGPQAFFRGWQPRVTWIAIGGSIFFLALDQAQKVLVPPRQPSIQEVSINK